MKLISVNYLGFTAMDRRFSAPMLPWIVSEIKKRDYIERISVGVEDGYLQAYNSDFEVQFSHSVSMIYRFSQADVDPCTFLYLYRDDTDQILFCYLFNALRVSDFNEDVRDEIDEASMNTEYPKLIEREVVKHIIIHRSTLPMYFNEVEDALQKPSSPLFEPD